MKTQHSFLSVLTGSFVLLCSVMLLAEPKSTAFTYQGRLLDDNVAANGLYDFQFKLYDDPNGLPADQVGATFPVEDVDVVDGYFIAELDFGSGVFDGNARWLEVAVRPGTETGDHTLLSPLQPITPAPYALYAGQSPGGSGFWSANGNDIYNTNSGGVGIGTSDPVWELEVANPRAGEGAEIGVTANDASGAFAAYSSTLGFPFEHFSGRVSVFAGLETTGLDLRADGVNGDMRFYTGGPWLENEQMRIDSNGNVGIGTTNPVAPLEVHSNDTGALVRLNSDQSHGYMQFLEGGTPRAYVGFGDDGDILNNAIEDSFAIDALGSAMHLAVDSDAQKGITINTDGDVMIGQGANNYADSSGDLYVANDLEVDGTIYAKSGMPGCNYTDPTNFWDITSETVVSELTFTPPDSGYMIVTLTGTVQLSSGTDFARISIATPETLDRNSVTVSASNASFQQHPFSVQWAANCASDSTWTFYAVVDPYDNLGDPNADILNLVMTLMYFPVRY